MARPSNYGPITKRKAKYELERLLRYAYLNNLGRSADGRVDIKSSKEMLRNQKLKTLRKEMGWHVYDDMDEDIDNRDLWDKKLYPAITDYLSKFLNFIEDYTEPSKKAQGEWGLYLNVEEYGANSQLWIDTILSRFEAEWDHAKEIFDKNNRSKKDSRKERIPETNIEKLNGFLLNLNYKDQEREIEDAIDDLKGAGILLAEIDTEEMQRWMINRLIKKNDVLKGADCKHLLASQLVQYQQETDLWRLFVDSSGSSAVKFMDTICNNMKRARLSLYTIRKMEIVPDGGLTRIMGDFWENLQQRITKDPSIKDSKCVFIFIGNIGWTNKHSDFVTLDKVIAKKSLPKKVKLDHRGNLLTRKIDEQLDEIGSFVEPENTNKSIISLKKPWHPVSAECINKWSNTYYGGERAGDFFNKLSKATTGEWKSQINRKCPIVYRRSRVSVAGVESLSMVGINDGYSIPRRAA
jgi:inactive STAND